MTKNNFTRDYTIKIKDGAGRIAELFITGASIDEIIATGVPEYEAVEAVQSDAFYKAIARGEIGEDAWIIG